MRWLPILFLLPIIVEARVRATYPKPDELVLVKTALGIATIVQLPDAIQTAIIGDQSSFKVEYIDKAVTVKPLRYGARTNLYLVTAKERFNLTLVASAQDQADYVVYIRRKAATPTVKWTRFEKSSKENPLNLKIHRIGSAKDGFFVIDGTIESTLEEKIEPKDFWIYQGEKSKPIHSLFLSNRSVRKSVPMRWALSISKADLEKGPLTLTVKKQKPLLIEIPETSWR